MMIFGWLVWTAYDWCLINIFNDLKAKRIEKRIPLNFFLHRDTFGDLLDFAKGLGRLEDLAFEGDDQISLTIYDSLLNDRTQLENVIIIEEASEYDLQSIGFSESGEILVSTKEGITNTDKWVVYFEGKIDDPVLADLLSYSNTNMDQIISLRQRLSRVGCEAADINKELITFRYAGHWPEGYNYVIPLNDTLNPGWNHLKDNFYWEHYRNELYCGRTFW